MNNIIMVFGGDSVEHEISIITALQVYKQYTGKYNLIPIYLKKGKFYFINSMEINTFKTFNYKNEVQFEANQNYLKLHHKKINFLGVLIVSHGKKCEDGSIYSYFNVLNIPVIGQDQYVSAICHDKELAKKIGNTSALPYFSLFRQDIDNKLDEIIKKANRIGYPLIIKPCRLGSSVGIKKINNSNELLDQIKEVLYFDNKIIVEKYLNNFEELNIAVLKNKSKYLYSEIEKIKKGSILSYNDKYLNSSKSMIQEEKELPAIINEMLRDEIIKKSMELCTNLNTSGVVRIDYLYDKDKKKLYFNEINNIPGSLAYYLFDKVNIKINDLIDIIIDNGLEEIENNKMLIENYKDNILKSKNDSMKLFK